MGEIVSWIRVKHENCMNLTSRAPSRPRRRREYAAVKLFRGLDRFLFFKRFAQALDQAAAPFTDFEMFVEDRLVFAFDQTVEIIGYQRVERATTEHLAGGRGADDAPFDLRPHGDFVYLRLFPFAAAAACGARHPAIEVITDQFFEPRAIHRLNLRGRQEQARGSERTL